MIDFDFKLLSVWSWRLEIIKLHVSVYSFNSHILTHNNEHDEIDCMLNSRYAALRFNDVVLDCIVCDLTKPTINHLVGPDSKGMATCWVCKCTIGRVAICACSNIQFQGLHAMDSRQHDADLDQKISITAMTWSNPIWHIPNTGMAKWERRFVRKINKTGGVLQKHHRFIISKGFRLQSIISGICYNLIKEELAHPKSWTRGKRTKEQTVWIELKQPKHAKKGMTNNIPGLGLAAHKSIITIRYKAQKMTR